MTFDFENVFDHGKLKELLLHFQRTLIPGKIKWDREQRECHLTEAIKMLLAINYEKYSRFPKDKNVMNFEF